MEFSDYRKDAIRYWERRRVIWNILLIPPSLIAHIFAGGVAAGVGDPSQFGTPTVAALFCLAAVGANICYSLAYTVEFWMAGRAAEDAYRSSGRNLLFGFGCFIGVALAFSGGQSIALLQYPL